MTNNPTNPNGIFISAAIPFVLVLYVQHPGGLDGQWDRYLVNYDAFGDEIKREYAGSR